MKNNLFSNRKCADWKTSDAARQLLRVRVASAVWTQIDEDQVKYKYLTRNTNLLLLCIGTLTVRLPNGEHKISLFLSTFQSSEVL